MKDLELNVLKESASQLRVPALLRLSASLCRVGHSRTATCAAAERARLLAHLRLTRRLQSHDQLRRVAQLQGAGFFCGDAVITSRLLMTFSDGLVGVLFL